MVWSEVCLLGACSQPGNLELAHGALAEGRRLHPIWRLARLVGRHEGVTSKMLVDVPRPCRTASVKRIIMRTPGLRIPAATRPSV
jgi:hypothetical protein